MSTVATEMQMRLTLPPFRGKRLLWQSATLPAGNMTLNSCVWVPKARPPSQHKVCSIKHTPCQCGGSHESSMALPPFGPLYKGGPGSIKEALPLYKGQYSLLTSTVCNSC